MKSNQKQGTTPILELAKQVRAHLEEKGYSEKGLIRLQKIWNHFARYAQNSPFTLEIGISFLKDAYGIEWSEYPPPMKRYQRRSLSAIRFLRDYEITGEITIHRSMKPPYVWPEQFSDVVEQYIQYTTAAGYSNDYMRGVIRVIHGFLEFLSEQKIQNYNDIQVSHIMSHIQQNFTHLSVNCLRTYVGRIRSFMKFLYINQITECDISLLIPPVRNYKKSQIPTTWKPEEINLILSAIERETPDGKRDYAIFLIAAKLGLRIGDILSLKFENINWDNATIQISQSKTNQLLYLPMSDDIGWAIIDYLKAGRPQTDNNHIFVRHCAPFQVFSINNNFHYQVRKYASLAGIDVTSKKFYGLHSFRHSFASNLLEKGTPLQDISQLLGHNGISATSIYIKTSQEQLCLCALDPEIEVNIND